MVPEAGLLVMTSKRLTDNLSLFKIVCNLAYSGFTCVFDIRERNRTLNRNGAATTGH